MRRRSPSRELAAAVELIESTPPVPPPGRSVAEQDADALAHDPEYVREITGRWEPPVEPEPPAGFASPLPTTRTEANFGGIVCSTCDGSGCPDCTDPA